MISMCEHPKIKAVRLIMTDGRPFLREICASCDRKLWNHIPMVSDYEVTIASRKHQGKKLGEIAKLDPEYLIWLICESKASDRIKKAAARICSGKPYIVPQEGEIREKSSRYNPEEAVEMIKKIVENVEDKT